MRRAMTWGPVVLTVAAGAMLTGAEPVSPKALPPLPVPPVERHAMPPFLARITSSGDTRMQGVFEECIDPVARSAQARALVRPSVTLPPLTGCTNGYERRPDGSIHHETICDPAKGAKVGLRMVSDSTLGNVRMHVERTVVGPATGVSKTTVYDTQMVQLGPCPADLKPGQMRRPGGPVIGPDEAARLRKGAGGAL